MLVVDLHTLQTVNVLYLIDDVLLNGGRTLDGEDVARGDRTVGERSSCTYGVVLLHKDLLRERNEIFALLASLRCNDDLTITTLHLAHCNLTVDF